MNDVRAVDLWKGQKGLIINAVTVPVAKVVTGYKGDISRPVFAYEVRVAFDYNRSNVFPVQARTVNQLVKKLEKLHHLAPVR